MRIYGLDFTSAPGRAKPITLADAELGAGRLHVSGVYRIRSFAGFELGLETAGPWVAGMDFPFGLPRRLVEALSWPPDWTETVDRVAAMEREEFEKLLTVYKARRPKGDMEHLRTTDRIAGSLSPMKLFGVPLAKMYFEGAPRLRTAGLSVMPCRPTGDSRVVVEAYPALVARRVIGRRSYKGDGAKAKERRSARRELVAALGGDLVAEAYGVRVQVGAFLAEELEADAGGDLLDAVLCAIQAAWAHERRASNHGLPRACDPLEGWIADPATAVPGAK